MNMKKIAFENEMIIVNENQIPQNLINWEIASKVVIERIKKIVPEIINQWWIDQELDACQIEIRNMWPKDNLTEAQDELIKLFEITQNTLKNEFWLQVSKIVVPNQNFIPVPSRKIERYETIHKALLWVSVSHRKATNIAGLHLNIDSILSEHLNINNQIFELFHNWDLDTLWMTKERFEMYKKTVEWVNISMDMNLKVLPKYFGSLNDMKSDLLDENWEPKFDYNFIRLKKIKKQFISELRTFDWWVTEKDLLEKTKKAYELIDFLNIQYNSR